MVRTLLEAIDNPFYLNVLGGGEIAKPANNAIMRATRRAATEVDGVRGDYGLSEAVVRKAAAISSGAFWSSKL